MFISYSRADPESVGDGAASVHREAIFSWTTEETEDKLLFSSFHWRLYDPARCPPTLTWSMPTVQQATAALNPEQHGWKHSRLWKSIKPFAQEVFLFNWMAAQESSEDPG